MAPYKFAIIGNAWRARLIADIARRLPEELEVAGVVVRRPEAVPQAEQAMGARAFLTVEEMVRAVAPDFVVTAVPRSVNPTLVEAVVDLGCPVLTETPPAGPLDDLRALWSKVGDRRMVQVAEQYLLYPNHAARLQLVRQGVIGQPTSVQVSSTHGYHAVSIMRGFLGAGRGPVTVRASVFEAPLVDPLTRDGWTDDDNAKPARTTLATIDFGGSSGLYDFTDNQWHNQLRMRRLVVRGSLGEMVDDTVVHLAGPRAIVRSYLHRYQLGYDLNLDGYDTEHISFDGRVVYRNPFLGHRFMDEDIAIAGILVGTGAWSRDEGPPPYPLADGCQDQLVSLAIDEAAASGRTVTTTPEAWTDQV